MRERHKRGSCCTPYFVVFYFMLINIEADMIYKGGRGSGEIKINSKNKPKIIKIKIKNTAKKYYIIFSQS